MLIFLENITLSQLDELEKQIKLLSCLDFHDIPQGYILFLILVTWKESHEDVLEKIELDGSELKLNETKSSFINMMNLYKNLTPIFYEKTKQTVSEMIEKIKEKN